MTTIFLKVIFAYVTRNFVWWLNLHGNGNNLSFSNRYICVAMEIIILTQVYEQA